MSFEKKRQSVLLAATKRKVIFKSHRKIKKTCSSRNLPWSKKGSPSEISQGNKIDCIIS